MAMAVVLLNIFYTNDFSFTCSKKKSANKGVNKQYQDISNDDIFAI